MTVHALGYHIAIGKTVTESQAQEYMSMQTPALVSAEETHCCWQVHLSSPHAPVISSFSASHMCSLCSISAAAMAETDGDSHPKYQWHTASACA